MAASIWNPGSAIQTATGNGTVSEIVTLSAAQTLVPITLYNYTIGAKALFVYLNGVLQVLGSDYLETSTTSITLTNPATLNDVCELVGVINLVNVVTNVYDSTEVDIASGVTTDIGATRSNFLRVTGTTTINSFGTNFRGPIFVRFASALVLTYGPSLLLPGAVNMTIAVGDNIIATPKATAGVADGWIVTRR